MTQHQKTEVTVKDSRSDNEETTDTVRGESSTDTHLDRELKRAKRAGLRKIEKLMWVAGVA